MQERRTMPEVIVLSVFLIVLSCFGQTGLTVASGTGSLQSGAQTQFTVSETSADNPDGNWSTTCGAIDGDGIFTSPVVALDTSCTVTFTVIHTGKTASASITVTPAYDQLAQMPTVVIKSAMADTQAFGAITPVPAGASLQAAINNANCGDTLQLQAGATFTGSFTLPNKGCDDNHWIVIRTSADDSTLPAEGTRLTPCYAGVAALPGRPALNCRSTAVVTARIVGSAGTTLQLAAGANHYRIGPGLEITRLFKGLFYNLITPLSTADHIVIDRDWVRGTPQDETVRGLFLSGVVYAAVVDSYFSDFHCAANGACADAQAIGGGTGPYAQGRWKIDDNFLEASTENILLGGTMPNSVTPSDIWITRNHLFKPLLWMPGAAGFIGKADTTPSSCGNYDPNGGGQCPFVVKNLFELKNAQRLLFEGNVLENCWQGVGGQPCQSILIEGDNVDSGTIYSTISVANITIRYNLTNNTASGFGITNPSNRGGGGAPPDFPIYNYSVHDNLFAGITNQLYSGWGTTIGIGVEILTAPINISPRGISINHNTILFARGNPLLLVVGALATSPISGFSFTNNIASSPGTLPVNGSGPAAPCGFIGNTDVGRLNNCFNNPVFTANALIGASDNCYGNPCWPAGNFLPVDISAVGFNSDYSLSASSPYKGKGIDGRDLGADMSLVYNAIAAVQ